MISGEHSQLPEESRKPRAFSEELKNSVDETFARMGAGLSGFRERLSQKLMVDAVARAAGSTGGVAVIEAPTGCGKSLGYLCGALPVAQAAERKLVISTGTIALQEQLLRDIPKFLNATGMTAKVAIAKGRRRYVCVRDLYERASGEAQDELDFDDVDSRAAHSSSTEDTNVIGALAKAFSDEVWLGDLDIAPVAVPNHIIPLITTTQGGCAGRACSYASQCPFLIARKAVESADLIVANHSLTMADFSISTPDGVGGLLLPKPEKTIYVFDEGHRLEDEAIAAATVELNLSSALQRMSRLRKTVDAGFRLAAKETILGKSLPQANAMISELIASTNRMASEISQAWEIPATPEPVWRASLGQVPSAWRDRAIELKGLAEALTLWCQALLVAVKESTGNPKLRERAMRSVGLIAEHFKGQFKLWSRWAQQESADAPPVARWITVTGREHALTLHASSVSAAAMLAETVWAHADGVIITSATLSEAGKFKTLADALALPSRAECISLPSPFDLQRQGRLEIPWLAAFPGESERHAQEIAKWLSESIDWCAGSLVLFTSKQKMLRVASLMPAAQQAKLRIQGQRPKSLVLAEHAQAVADGGSVLFGLTSFGEGLDLPGALCSTVVVTQLPFSVPTEPVSATRDEWLSTHGRNAFNEVSLPSTIRTLSQWAGRLIRTETDVGRVVLLDRRIVAKHYGARMLNALPPFSRHIQYRQAA